ncbi:MAG: hypothetical protein CL868_18750 [Cytophagaceae bacterium]|nr:hypothetical protein [Cytophagaceae bacterium]
MNSSYHPSVYNTAMNNILRGLQAELEARTVRPLDFLVIGGAKLSGADMQEILRFAMTKNWELLHVGMDPARTCTTFDAQALDLTYFITDGKTEAKAILNGAVWKHPRDARAKLIFDVGFPLEACIHKNGSACLREGSACNYGAGIALAERSIRERIAKLAPTGKVLFTMGSTPIACNIATFARLTKAE